MKKEPIIITESHLSLTQKEANDYLIPIKNSKFHTIIIHSTNTRIYLKNNEIITDITSTLLPIPPTYSNRKMIRLDTEKLHDYDSILIQVEKQKSQVDVYQIENAEQTVELST